ncbi:replication associated protein [Faeces associated gemycircularvirus 12]|uniref:Replication associated protein n=1 Tax=Faeces associated gemycircularvirus 12 TaxID=1391027 RepID=T1YRW7_9VIRU|nr:replication associated protein [Faeces associated gemycircularvirus 12]AGU67647.1 replication associated protein [Faeces associated gemycircularvirus 12]
MPFRFDNKRVFLTYSQVGQRTLDSIYDFLSTLKDGRGELVAIEYIVVARERHLDGGFHFHAFILFRERFQSRNQRIFDFDGLHPNIESVRGERNVANKITYTKKDGEFKEHGDEPTVAERANKQQHWLDLIDSSTDAADFMGKAKSVAPRDFVLQNDKFEAFARKYYNNVATYVSEYGPEDFVVPAECNDWVRDVLNEVCFLGTCYSQIPNSNIVRILGTRSSQMLGPHRRRRTRQTEWARCLGDHFYNSTWFNLDEVDPSKKYAVFDDIRLNEKSYWSWKPWFGGQKEFTVTDKFRHKRKLMWGKPIIWVCNPASDPRNIAGLDSAKFAESNPRCARRAQEIELILCNTPNPNGMFCEDVVCILYIFVIHRVGPIKPPSNYIG